MKLLKACALLLSLLALPLYADVLYEYQLKKYNCNYLLRKYEHTGWTLVEITDSKEVGEVTLLGEPLLVSTEVFMITPNHQYFFTFVGDPSTAQIRRAEACRYLDDTVLTLTE